MFPATSCTASSEADKSFKCSNAYDGIMEPGRGQEEASQIREIGGCIRVYKEFTQMFETSL